MIGPAMGIVDILKQKLKELPESIEKGYNLLDAIGYNEQSYQRITSLIENVVDLMIFNYQKKARNVSDGGKVYAAQLMLESFLAPEGLELLNFLEDHIHTNDMKFYIISQVFVHFEVKMGVRFNRVPPPNTEI